MARALARRHAAWAIVLAVAASLAIYWWPPLRPLAWPLLLGSTLAHELGHGLAAITVGGSFQALEMYADASGVASYRGAFSRGEIAWVAAVGLLGPPLVAAMLFVAGRTLRASHVLLALLAVLLAITAVLWAGNSFTLIYCAVLAGLLGACAIWAGPRLSQLICVFMAVQLGLASFTRADYLFTDIAETGQGGMLSDVGQIAAWGWGPYWLWGGVVAALSLIVLLWGAWRFLQALR